MFGEFYKLAAVVRFARAIEAAATSVRDQLPSIFVARACTLSRPTEHASGFYTASNGTLKA